jgi:hypothetical protein
MIEEHEVLTHRKYEAPAIRKIGSLSDLTLQGHHPHQHHLGCFDKSGHGTGAHWCYDPSDPGLS